MQISQTKINGLLYLLKKKFPDFNNFSNSGFLKEEVDYKKETVQKAKNQLDKNKLLKLIEEKNFNEIIHRIEEIGKDNNLLWRSVPQQGDLNILYQDNLDKLSFCRVFFDLLYGKGEHAERLEKYLNYVNKNNLPNRWTFPTYFLFICFPESEYFVKPETTKWFLKYIGKEKVWSDTPNVKSYQAIRETVYELKDSLNEYSPENIIDIQGFIWTSFAINNEQAMTKEKKEEFLSLFEEFFSTYLKTPQGQEHNELYKTTRVTGKINFDEVIRAEQTGKDITDLVLLKLFSYSKSKSNIEKGAWITVAPVIMGDIKKWFENIGWASPDNWEKISRAVLEFVKNCNNFPKNLKAACEKFSKLDFIKGIQAGFLSPILNALNPNEFKLINIKPIRVLNYFTESKLDQTLIDYPKALEKAEQLSKELSADLKKYDITEIRDDDLFDMFCHWLNAEKKYNFGKTKYWKISPGENAWNWKKCKNSGVITIGWDDLGDISELNRNQFNKKRDELIKKFPDWTKNGVDQVWKFAKNIKAGDYIIANQGTSNVLGIGMVTGEYFFIKGERYDHHRPIDWVDTKKRKIDEPGWKRTIIELDKKKFDKIKNAGEVIEEAAGTDEYSIFQPETFRLLEELHHNPTSKFYLSKKDEFKKFIEKPMYKIMKLVAEELPNKITEVMETENNLFSRIIKNDYGRGGAWDYYWAAFYPKGGKRIEDAQLSIFINKDRFEYGSHIGEYGSEQKKKFLNNCKNNYNILEKILQPILDDESIVFGTHEELLTDNKLQSTYRSDVEGKDWLKNPDDYGVDIAVLVPKEEIIKISTKDLKEKILEYFKKMFPFIILSISDNPMQEINDYLKIDYFNKSEMQPAYPLSQCSADTGVEKKELEKWVNAIERKKQAVFYGPPGTGKTFIAEKMARHLIEGNDGFSELVQFHPSYAYEDFIQGIRPLARSDGKLDFKIVKGRFLNFCDKAKKRNGTCVLIVDELNRANLSKVFGELMYLLEYRNKEVPLAQGNSLSIPENVRILGTMNTADRSIALVDHALRRRFSFIPLYPNYKVLSNFHKKTGFSVAKLISVLEELNNEIDDKNYHVGITFFLNNNLNKNIESIWRMEIEPYLEEYFFDQSEKVSNYRWEKIKDKIF